MSLESAHGKSCSKHARLQNTIELMTTYSWAIIITGIALAALFALGILNPQSAAASVCIINQAFQCSKLYLATNGILTFTLLQDQYQLANITAVGCSENVSNSHITAFTVANQIEMPQGTERNVSVQCYGPSSKFSGSVGTVLNATLYINYIDDVGSFPYSISGKVYAKIT